MELFEALAKSLRIKVRIERNNKWIKEDQPDSVAIYWPNELDNNSKLLIRRVLFSEEGKVSISEFVDNHNCLIWGSERRNKVCQQLNNSPSVMIWCAVSKKEIFGPDVFENKNETCASQQKHFTLLCVYKTSKLPIGYYFSFHGINWRIWYTAYLLTPYQTERQKVQRQWQLVTKARSNPISKTWKIVLTLYFENKVVIFNMFSTYENLICYSQRNINELN